MKPILAYVNAPWKIYSFKEICNINGCETDVLYIGVEHTLNYNENEEIRFIFENDSASD